MKDYTLLVNDLPDVPFKAKDVGLAAATLTAMVRRGLIEKIGSASPYTYAKVQGNVKLVNVSTAYKTAGEPEFITVYFEDRELPILCTYKNAAVYDCYGKLCDATKILKIEVYKEGKCQTFLV